MRNVTARPWSAMIRNETSVRSASPYATPVACSDVATIGRIDVGLEDGVDALQHGCDTFEACPGIDVLRREVAHDVIRLVLDVLHEHQIPYLDMPFVIDRWPAGQAEGRTLVEEDL